MKKNYLTSLTPFLIIILTYGFVQCKPDNDYHLFIHDEPERFIVSPINPPTRASVCEVENNEVAFGLDLLAVNKDGSPNDHYGRSVNLYIADSAGNTGTISPWKSPKFQNGAVTIENVSISNIRTGDHVIKVKDERYGDIEGSSGPFSMIVDNIDHFEITLPSNVYNGIQFYLYVEALTENGTRFYDFNGAVDINITNGFTIDPSTYTTAWTSGYVNIPVIIDGPAGSDFAISVLVSEDQPDFDLCLGGLEGLGGGQGIGLQLEEPPHPDSITCTLTGPSGSDTVMVGESFQLSIQVIKMDSVGSQILTFNGDAAFSISGNLTDLSPLSKTILSDNVSWDDFTVSHSTGDGMGIITATVNDTVDTEIDPCDCTTDIEVLQGIGVYGDGEQIGAQAFVDALNNHSGLSQRFILTNNLDDLEFYEGLILNFAGQSKEAGQVWGRALSDSEADQVTAFASTKPVILAHDNITATVLDSLVNSVFGIDSSSIVDFDPRIVTFSCTGHEICNGISTVNNYVETTSRGYNSSGSSSSVAGFSPGGNHAVLVRDNSGTRSALMCDAIMHDKGEENTQWFETNEQLIINLINWVFQ